MADATVNLRIGEKRAVAGSIRVSTGTETITSVKVTLRYKGQPVTGVDDIDVVQSENGGWTTDAVAEPQAWYVVDTVELDLVAGKYFLAFYITDSAGNIYEPVIRMFVRSNGT